MVSLSSCEEPSSFRSRYPSMWPDCLSLSLELVILLPVSTCVMRSRIPRKVCSLNSGFGTAVSQVTWVPWGSVTCVCRGVGRVPSAFPAAHALVSPRSGTSRSSVCGALWRRVASSSHLCHLSPSSPRTFLSATILHNGLSHGFFLDFHDPCAVANWFRRRPGGRGVSPGSCADYDRWSIHTLACFAGSGPHG